MTSPLDVIRQMGDQLIHASPQAKALGMTLVSVEHAEAVLKIAYKPELVGDPDTGVVAGGVITTLLDQTCAQSIWAALPEYTSIATLDLRIDYMRPAKAGADIFAHAHCYRLTRSVAFVRAQAYDESLDDPIATAQAAFMLDAHAGRPGGEPKPRFGPNGGGDPA